MKNKEKASQPSGEEWERFKYYDLPLPIGAITEEANKAIKSFISRIAQEERERGRRDVVEAIPTRLSDLEGKGGVRKLKQQLKEKFNL